MITSEPRVVRLSEVISQVEQACPCMMEVPAPWPEALQACRAWIAQNLGTLKEDEHGS